jgi:hypothetical protein
MSGSQLGELAILGDTAEALSRVRALLLQPTPQNLDIACSALASAIAQVTDLQTVVATSSPSRDLNAAVVGLSKEVDLISRLLEHAASFHVNLIQCMIEASGSLTRQVPSNGSTGRISMDA